MLLQGYGGHDCNCATPMNLVASLIMTVELELEHLVWIKNECDFSVRNSIQHNVGGCDFGMHTLNCPRLESTKKVEDKIKQAKIIKKILSQKCAWWMLNERLFSFYATILWWNRLHYKEWKCDNRKVRIGNIIEDEKSIKK